MSILNFLSHPLTKKEKILGCGYFLFQKLALGLLLHWVNSLLATPMSLSALNVLAFSINFLAVALILRSFLLSQLRLIPEIIEKVIKVAIKGFFAYWITSFFLSLILLFIDPGFSNVNDETIRDMAQTDYALVFFCSVILVPITEECLYRGVLFRGLYDHNRVLAWICSVALFAAAHVTVYIGIYPIPTLLLCFVQYIPAGICLAAAYRFSGSILTPILIHAAVNIIGMMALR